MDNREELLKEARKRYVYGTRVSLSHINHKDCPTVGNNPNFIYDNKYGERICVNTVEKGDANYSMAIYANGKWAVVINKPIIISNYYFY